MKNIFDGQGAVSHSWLFYGGYPEVITNRYYLALVYLLLICLTYFGSLFVVLKSIGEGRQPALSSSRSHRYKFSMLVLSSWDHSITSDEASSNLSKGIASILKGTGQTSNFLNVYGTTLIFSLINIIVPMCISKLPVIENYASGKLELNITLARVFCLRMANLFALVASLYSNVTKLTEECTGTVIGQEFYKLVVMDTIVHVVVQLSMAFGRYFWTMQKYEFNLSGAALVLIYRQGLVWVGTIACPVLPLAGALSNLIFFFVNYLIVSRTCKPPIKRWNQSRNTTFLMGFLLITIMFIIVPVSVAIGSAEIIQLGQSNHGMESCGPFGLEKPTAVYMKFRIQQVAWLQSALTWVVSDSVLIAVFLVLL
ncbi:hypothetical protein FSP39_023041 [Pinctada imbricata]|uniref:TMC domain-containing protein n=1 Tax=Pinctada imbricata TaxID=66713 RepID=A0AA88YW13_PINIB|nr:hypothetical protein FSP39_023041 [Pinctada imbricata]